MADERDLIEFDTEYVLSEVFPDRIEAPDRYRKCSQCGGDSKAWPASDLTVIKHRVSTQPLGHLRLYCHEHITVAKEWGSVGRQSDKVGPVCPNCHTTIPLGTQECDMCGWTPPE